MNTNQTYFDQSELNRLFELRTQAVRLANKIFEVVFSEQSESFPYAERFRLHRLWLKSQARYDRRRLAWHKALNLFQKTEQLAAAVEREAFPELADVGRSSVQSAELVGQESN